MPAVSIDDAGLDDAPRIAHIWLEAHVARRGHFDDLADIRAVIAERLRKRDSAFFLAKEAEHVVGIGSQLPARASDGTGPVVPGLMHLSMIAVDPAHWGKGIGKALTEHGVHRAQRLGYDAIQLWTHVSNTRAQRLYTSVGFQETGREKTDDRGERIRLYVLRLGNTAQLSGTPNQSSSSPNE